MTWRIRLRTDLNHTDDLGVRFGAAVMRLPTPGRPTVTRTTPGSPPTMANDPTPRSPTVAVRRRGVARES